MNERVPAVMAVGISLVIIAYACATAPTTNPSPGENVPANRPVTLPAPTPGAPAQGGPRAPLTDSARRVRDSVTAARRDSGAAMVLHDDGRKVTQIVDGGGDVEIKGHWQGSDFVVERKVSGGGKVTEDYLRSQDGKQLYVIVKFEGGRGRSIEFRRVYNGAAAK